MKKRIFSFKITILSYLATIVLIIVPIIKPDSNAQTPNRDNENGRWVLMNETPKINKNLSLKPGTKGEIFSNSLRYSFDNNGKWAVEIEWPTPPRILIHDKLKPLKRFPEDMQEYGWEMSLKITESEYSKSSKYKGWICGPLINVTYSDTNCSYSKSIENDLIFNEKNQSKVPDFHKIVLRNFICILATSEKDIIKMYLSFDVPYSFLDGYPSRRFDGHVNCTQSLGTVEYDYKYETSPYKANTEEIPNESDSKKDNTVGTPTTSEPLNNIPWTIIIGSISAVVIATIIRRLLKKKKPKAEVAAEKTAEEEAEAVHYILQLNRDSFRLKINQPEILEIQVWKITTRGKSKIQAQVSIENPEKNLTIRSRNTGSGLIADLCLDKPPASSNFELTVLATAEGIPIQKSISITTSDKMEIIIETIPNNRRTLRPDTKKVLTCCAKVVDENGKPLIDLTKKLKFKPQSKWIDLSDPVMDGDHIAINVGASNPDQNSVRSNIPHDITLSVILDAIKENEKPVQSDLVIVLQDCLLDTDIERCSFPVAEHQTEISFKAFIQNCDSEEKWDFKAEYRRGTDPLEKPLSEISILKTSDTEASITLKGPLTVPEADEASITEKLVIFACQSDETPLERHLPVTVSQVGLFITGHLNEKKELSYLADKPFETDIEFVLYQLDKETNKVIVDQEGLKRLTFELKNEEKDIRNFAQVLKPVFTFKDLVGNIPYGRYKYSSTGEMPGFGDVFTLTYIVHAPCDGDENSAQFSQELKVLVKTAGIGEGFPDWEKAYRDCKRIIDIYVPAGNLRSQLSELLEQKKMMLDVEGLIYLRHEIWQKAYNLILKEGEAYLQEAEWNDKVMSLLDWTKWAGDIAFKVLTTYLGPIAGTIAEISKPTIVEAIIAYNEGITFEQLIRKVGKNLLVNTAETGKGKINNMEFIEAKLIKNKVNAWAFFIAVEFAWHYLVKKEDKQTYVDSAKAAGESIRDEVFVPGVIPYANTSIGDLGKQGAGFIKKLALRLSEVRIS